MLVMKSNNGWQLQTIANGHLSCEHFDLVPDDIDRIEQKLLPEFGDLMKKERIIVSYDNSSGIFIMQMPGVNTDSSDNVIKEIYNYLSGSDK